MNRPGQPPQRPPSLGPNPGLTGPFRGPFQYNMPPRNVLQGGFVPALQPSNHRTPAQQTQLSQPTAGFIQQRQNTFPFGGTLSQTQTSQGQHPASTLQGHSTTTQSSPQQQQQSNGASSSIPPHLSQNATTPSLGGRTAPSVSSASDVGLDPNDFPALGSTPANTNTNSNGNTGNNVTTSYASQAGTALGGTGVSSATTGTGSNTQPRDFTPDDFPALGGQPQSHSSNSNSQSLSQGQDSNHAHPPGLNGFQPSDHSQQQHRQNLLGTLGGLQTPGMLNLGPTQARNVHPGFQQTQSEADKQQQRNNYALKLNPASQAAWNSPNTNTGTQSAVNASVFSNSNPISSTTTATTTTSTATTTQQNGTLPIPTPAAQQPPSQPQQLSAPPGVPGPYTQTQQESSGIGLPNAYTSNGDAANPNPNPNPPNHPPHPTTHPQTPAQQILMSAADRWGLLGLLQMIKNAGTDVDHGLSSIGTDLGTMGLDMGYSGNLYSTFITPWADQSAAHSVEPDFHLPACYNVQTLPPGPSKAAAFSDETLFFMFYSSPRDALQEVAAQELFQRNWRFHKELRLWITKEAGTTASQKIPGGEQGTYTVWDPDNWGKERKDMAVLYVDLEEKNVPAFAQGPTLVLAQGTQSQGQGTGQPQQPQGQASHVQAQLPPTQRGSFQTGMGAL